MAELKLPKLPDRAPVKFTITVKPELAQALREYRDCYEATYGAAEDVSELIPFMLAAFIESDAGFRKAKRGREVSPVGRSRERPSPARGSESVALVSPQSSQLRP